jgi:hypothetical protein
VGGRCGPASVGQAALQEKLQRNSESSLSSLTRLSVPLVKVGVLERIFSENIHSCQENESKKIYDLRSRGGITPSNSRRSRAEIGCQEPDRARERRRTRIRPAYTGRKRECERPTCGGFGRSKGATATAGRRGRGTGGKDGEGVEWGSAQGARGGAPARFGRCSKTLRSAELRAADACVRRAFHPSPTFSLQFPHGFEAFALCRRRANWFWLHPGWCRQGIYREREGDREKERVEE